MKTLTYVLAMITLTLGAYAQEPVATSSTPTEPEVLEARRTAMEQEQLAMMEQERQLARQARSVAGLRSNVMAARIGGGAAGDPTDRILIVPSARTTAQDRTAIQEDLTVMDRIVGKRMEQAQLVRTSFDVFVGNGWRFGGNDHQILYLADYGAVLIRQVDFPLSSPTEVNEPTPTETDQDPVWAQARQEVFEPDSVTVSVTEQKAVAYDADKVERLKDTLVKSLRHAANIRALRPEDRIVFVVKAPPQGTQHVIRTLYGNEGRRSPALVGGVIGVPAGPAEPADQASTLVVEARKADVDRLAGNQETFDEFKQKVHVTLY